MMILLSWSLLAQLVLTVWADDLSVPSSWVKPTVEASREERINRTVEAIDAFIASDALFTSTQPPSKLPDQYWPYGEFLALIADFDIITNQTRYKQIVQERFLPALQRTTPDLVPVQDVDTLLYRIVGNKFRYGYAATRAYLAYQDEGFLTIAKDYWTSNRSLTLSDEDVQSRSSPAKSKINSDVSLSCSKPGSEYTLAGGTFHSTDQNNLIITTGSTVDYLTLTVSLATVSSDFDSTYATLASQMGQFMRNTIYKDPGVFYSSIEVGDPDCPSRIDDRATAPSDAAVTMQSLSLLTLGSKNDDCTDVLRDIARRSTGSTWNSADGVLDTLKVSMVASSKDATPMSHRLLRSHFDMALGDGASDLKVYLRAYLAVQASALSPGVGCPLSDQECGDQYDALAKLATFPSSVPNLYGNGLRPASRFIPEAQIQAIGILLGGVISSDNATSPNGPRTTDAITPDTGRAPIGAIVGGIVGGVLGLALVIAGIYHYLRRQRRMRFPPPTVDPYPTTSPMNLPMRPPPISTFRPSQSRAFVKRAPPMNVAERIVSSSIPTASESRPSRMHETTTAELVTMLNQRLRNEQWDANESPPEYYGST
ncbi:hypothetical protein PQX77_002998 [Marasmius sp. AFHP31]|nr:hypothetical protein PQX77_002998 [Marasmius sp. AFHP31]